MNTERNEERGPAAAEVLVVDDNPANLTLLASLLDRSGYEARVAVEGGAALRAVEAQLPDLILLDIGLPDIDGYEVCRRLKAEARSAEVPIIFISALNETIDKVRAFQVGGVDYITKPFQFDEVKVRVETHLRLRRLQAELAAQNRQLADNYQRLKRLEAMRDDLTHLIVHDLRSPLQGIQLSYDLLTTLLAADVSAEMKSVVDGLGFSTRAMRELVDTLLDVHRLEANKMVLSYGSVNACHLFDDALKVLGPVVGARPIERCAEAANMAIECDVALIRRVVTNLLGNAVKHTEAGVRVRFSVEERGDTVVMKVIDEGPGIPPEYRHRIFEKFGQIEGRQAGRKGTGLGLTFCKLAVEAHHGEIGLDSEVGKGSTFWVVLPKKRL